MFNIAFNSITVLVICMLIGYICQKKGLITQAGEPVLSGLLVNVTLPCLMIVSMQKEFDQVLFNNSIMVLFISFIIHFFGYFVGTVVCKLFKAEKAEIGVLTFALTFPNIAYMGFPIIESIYGPESVFYVSMCNVAFNVLAFTLGIKVITKSSDHEEGYNLRKILLNIPILATIVGFAFFVLSVSLPQTVYNALNSVGNMTTPLSMIVIGAILAKNDLRTVLSGWKMYGVMFVRLIIMPLLAYLILNTIIEDKMIVGVLVILTGMPVASLTAILAAQYNANRDLASKIVFISTVVSVLTIPLLSLILDM